MKKNKGLEKQILLKVTPEMDDMITVKWVEYMNNSKKHITRNEFIRKILVVALTQGGDGWFGV